MAKNKTIAYPGIENQEYNDIFLQSHYFNILSLLAITRFEWVGLPESMDARFLEKTLFWHGSSLVFNHNFYNLLNLPFTSQGELNLYDYPIIRRPYSVANIELGEYNQFNSVIIYDNYLRTTPLLGIIEYTKRLYNIVTSLDVNTEAIRQPIIIECEESQKFSIEKFLNKRKNGEPVIIGNKTLDLMKINVFPTVTKELVDSINVLREYKKDIWNEALSFLGINNVSEKKERMITDEAKANNNLIFSMRNICLASRKKAAHEINKMFGLNINVRYRTYEEIISELELENEVI